MVDDDAGEEAGTGNSASDADNASGDADHANGEGGHANKNADHANKEGDHANKDADHANEETDPVEIGVELLSKLEHPELTVAEAVDRIETVTTHPATTRKILDEAEKRGFIEREDGIIKTTGGGYVKYQSEVITKEGEFSCRRCGANISTGYFINLDAGEHGAFGPECIRKVTGRD